MKRDLKFKIGEKVLLISKSTGRELFAVKRDIPTLNNCPVGWIAEYRKNYYVIAYQQGQKGIDYYLEKDLEKPNFFEDNLFEI